jgi:eukaryotic-like serine/threonine-protein kinase
MNPEFERRLLELVDRALELPAESRAAFLHKACGGDTALETAAAELIASCAKAEADDRFLVDSAAVFADPIIRAVEEEEEEDSEEPLKRVSALLEGRYKFGREIGRGGNAIVYLARDLQHSRDVAIKVIRQGVADPDRRHRFLREVEISAQLRHPFVIPLIDSGETQGTLFYVMPYVEGESLRDLLDREGALSLTSALTVARDVAEALDFAHSQGIVHRDIKPENILLSGSHALVADFGIAMALEASGTDRVTEKGVAVGTPAYMSPEQAGASERIDGRSDIYALGCVVYEMLAGEVPYLGETPRAILAKHLQAPVPDLTILRPGLSPAAQATMRRALAKVPAERFSKATEFINELTAEAGGDGRQATGDEWLGKRPRRLRGFVTFVASVAVVAFVAFWARRFIPPSRPPALPPSLERIAVLYFDNLSSDPEVGLIAQGLTEDVIDELSQVHGLHVISPNGVRLYRDHPAPVDSIAKVLGVGTVVGGSISASADIVRVTVRLVDPSNGDQLRTQSFEVQRGAALALRQAVVGQVATFLRERLGQEVKLRKERKETQSLEAWERVTRADDLVRDGVDASLAGNEADATDLWHRADSLYAVAENLDRKWVTPTIGRGWVALRLALFTQDTLPYGPMMQRALTIANQALARSNGGPQALALRGYAREWLATSPNVTSADTLKRQAEADLRAALDARPDDARSWYALGELLYTDGRYTESAQALETALNRDAFLVEVRAVVSLLFFASLNLEKFDDASRWCEMGITQYAGDPRFQTCRLILLGWTGKSSRDVGKAWQEIETIERSDSIGMFSSQWRYFRMIAAMTAARAGLKDSARAIIAKVHEDSAAHPGTEVRMEEAYVFLLLGQRDEALTLLRDELKNDPDSRGRIMRSPWFRPLAADLKS